MRDVERIVGADTKLENLSPASALGEDYCLLIKGGITEIEFVLEGNIFLIKLLKKPFCGIYNYIHIFVC